MIPEIELQKIIDVAISIIRDDITQNGGVPSDTIIHYLLDGEGSFEGKYDFYDQAVDIFKNKDEHNPRFLESRLFFDKERAAIPTIHIMANGENNNNNGIGVDQGFVGEHVNGAGTSQRAVYNRHFDANFSIVITSDNSMETILIFYVLKAMLISAFDHIQLSGFVNPQISGRDINISQDLLPNGIFARSIDLKAGYELSVPANTFRSIILKFISILNPVTN